MSNVINGYIADGKQSITTVCEQDMYSVAVLVQNQRHASIFEGCSTCKKLYKCKNTLIYWLMDCVFIICSRDYDMSKSGDYICY